MKFAQIAGMNRNPLLAVPRYEEFVRQDLPYSSEAQEFIVSELAAVGRDRTNSFSASALGSCGRQQQFTYIGLPKEPETAQRMAVLHNGKMVHLRIQAVGLSEGFLKHAEVPVDMNVLGLKGTLDGVMDGDEVFEIKSINDRGFKHVKYNKAPKETHVFQVGTYMLTTNRDKAVIFYENKNDQSVLEYTVHRDDALETKIIGQRVRLENETADRKLLPMLPKCVEKEGWEYDYCAYRTQCPLMKSFTEAQAHATRQKEAS